LRGTNLLLEIFQGTRNRKIKRLPKWTEGSVPHNIGNFEELVYILLRSFQGGNAIDELDKLCGPKPARNTVSA
jgi:hypothetical protein